MNGRPRIKTYMTRELVTLTPDMEINRAMHLLIMSGQPQTLDAELDLVEAAEAFLASSFRRFPVMSEGRLVGQISRSDLLKALAGNWR